MHSVALLWLANRVSRLTPITRGFALRAALFRASGVSIHSSAHVCGGVTFDNPYANVGANSWIGPDSHIVGGPGAEVVIAENCDLGPDVLIVVGTHEIGPSSRRAGNGASHSVVIEAGVWIGARATVLSGVTVGAGSVVAAGAVVANNIAPNTLAGGVPARPIRSLVNEIYSITERSNSR